jgi:predicted metal-binding membrane protein
MMARWRVAVAPGFAPLALSLAGLAWLMLVGWEASPHSRYLHHGDWSAIGLGAAFCTAVPGGAWVIPVVLYAASWLLMSAAMMLPTTLPLIRLFDRMIAGRRDGAILHALLIAGYLLAWSGFGIAAHILDWSLHRSLSGWAWLAERPWVPSAVVLALAGAFQFSSFKYHCLEKCRTPIGFITRHWHGPRPWREAVTLGLSHGLYCVGCCWLLMLLMFVVGTGNLGWMLLLGLIMATEKNHLWGRWLSAPLGSALLTVAGILVLRAMV